jgi:hypothetical protein
MKEWRTRIVEIGGIGSSGGARKNVLADGTNKYCYDVFAE